MFDKKSYLLAIPEKCCLTCKYSKNLNNNIYLDCGETKVFTLGLCKNFESMFKKENKND